MPSSESGPISSDMMECRRPQPVTRLGSANDVMNEPVSSADMEEIIQQYGGCIEKFNFERARELVEQFREKRLTVCSTQRECAWAALLSSLGQLALCDRGYFSLTFFQPRHFFRKEHALRIQYDHIGQSLSRAAVDISGQQDQTRVAGHVIEQMRAYAAGRVEMIQFYTKLSIQGTEREPDYAALLDDVKRLSEIPCAFHHPCLSPLAAAFAAECDVIAQLLGVQMVLTECKMMESILRLKELRERLQFWLRGVEIAADQSRGGIFSLFRASAPSPRIRLAHWLLQWHQLVVAKSALYLADHILPHHAPRDTAKHVHSSWAQPALLARATAWQRKAGAVLLCIVWDRSEQEEGEWMGLGYHRVTQRYYQPTEREREQTAPLQGRTAVYPCVLKLSSDKGAFDRLHAEIACFVQKMRKESRPGQLFDGKLDKTFFGEHLEASLYAVAVMPGRMADKDCGAVEYLHDLSETLRGRRLFADLRASAKN